MISFTLDDLQPLLDGCASPLLLFEGDTLLSLNQAARHRTRNWLRHSSGFGTMPSGRC